MEESRKSPKAPGSRWLTAPDAATLIGHSERGARGWLDRYDIPFRDGRPRRWSEAAILDRLAALGELPGKIPEAVPERPRNAPAVAPDDFCSAAEPIEARFRLAEEPATALVPFERVTQLTAGMVERIGALTVRNEALALEVGQLRERTAGHGTQFAAKDETIAELRRRAEVAEAEALRLWLAEAPPPWWLSPTKKRRQRRTRWRRPRPLRAPHRASGSVSGTCGAGGRPDAALGHRDLV